MKGQNLRAVLVIFTLVMLFWLTAIVVRAQTAVVVKLRIVDAITVQRVWKEKEAANAEWEKVRQRIGEEYAKGWGAGETYVCETNTPPPVCNLVYDNFEFSKDFDYIVPKSPRPSGSWGSYSLPSPNCPPLTFTTPITIAR